MKGRFAMAPGVPSTPPTNVTPVVDAVERLTATIEKANAETAVQNVRMLRLTWWITALTWVMAIVAVIQAWPFLKTIWSFLNARYGP